MSIRNYLNEAILFMVILYIPSCCGNSKSIDSTQFSRLEKYSPRPDHSSPESLIKSLWQYKIWSDTVFFYDSTLSIK